MPDFVRCAAVTASFDMKLSCQVCGFTVFNRRYPKCESCGAVLAAGLAMTPEERSAALEADRIESEHAAREKKREAHAAGSGDGGYIDVSAGGDGGGGDGGCGG